MELVKSEPEARINDKAAPALTYKGGTDEAQAREFVRREAEEDLFHVHEFRRPAWSAW